MEFLQNVLLTREQAKCYDELHNYIASEERVAKKAKAGVHDYYRIRNGNDITVMWKKRADTGKTD